MAEQSMAQRKGQMQAQLNRDETNAVSCYMHVPFTCDFVRIAHPICHHL